MTRVRSLLPLVVQRTNGPLYLLQRTNGPLYPYMADDGPLYDVPCRLPSRKGGDDDEGWEGNPSSSSPVAQFA